MALWIRVEPTVASWVLRKNRHFITRSLLLLPCPPSYMEEEPGGGEDVPQRGVAATATATGGCGLARSVDSVVRRLRGGTHVPAVACSEQTSP